MKFLYTKEDLERIIEARKDELPKGLKVDPRNPSEEVLRCLELERVVAFQRKEK